MSADDCWVPPGRTAEIAGYTIHTGMLYVGRGLPSIAGLGVEPALIDPTLPVDRESPDRVGAGMPYWPSYGSISPQSRAAYLEWLASDRRDPASYIGYVFLYFYGLERRALAQAPSSDQANADLPAIFNEVDQLLQIYQGNRSFEGYASRFLDTLKVLSPGPSDFAPPLQRTGYEMPVSLRVGLGQLVAAGKPIPPDWALSWYLTHLESSLRTSVRRCPNEFHDLFRKRYAGKFGAGLQLKPNQSKLKVSLQPASASFGGRLELSMDLPDVAATTSPLAKLRDIGEGCAADLDAYSRWVGRNEGAPKTVAAVALLPAELATTSMSEEAQGLWKWVGEAITQEQAVCDATDLLKHCASFGSGTLAKGEAVLLAQLLEKGGYGIEPDVRFGGIPLSPGDKAVLFKLPPGAGAIASPQYAAVVLLLRLAIAVSAADGSISASEEQHLKEHLQRVLGFGEAERLRLSAHLRWLTQSQPNLAGLRKRLEPLDQRQRSTIAEFIISVAGADGEISPTEVRTISKLYPLLGLDSGQVYSHIHAMTTGADTPIRSDEPVTVIPGMTKTGHAVPRRPAPDGAIRLNMNTVNAKIADSARISSILEDIFTDDDPVNPPAISPVTSSRRGVSAGHTALLTRLVERPDWTRSEFEALCAECGLLPDGAIDALNEASLERAGIPVLQGDDPIEVDMPTAKDLLT